MVWESISSGEKCYKFFQVLKILYNTSLYIYYLFEKYHFTLSSKDHSREQLTHIILSKLKTHIQMRKLRTGLLQKIF